MPLNATVIYIQFPGCRSHRNATRDRDAMIHSDADANLLIGKELNPSVFSE